MQSFQRVRGTSNGPGVYDFRGHHVGYRTESYELGEVAWRLTKSRSLAGVFPALVKLFVGPYCRNGVEMILSGLVI